MTIRLRVVDSGIWRDSFPKESQGLVAEAMDAKGQTECSEKFSSVEMHSLGQNLWTAGGQKPLPGTPQLAIPLSDPGKARHPQREMTFGGGGSLRC